MNNLNSRELLLLNLKRNDIEYSVKAREALLNAEDALRKKDIMFARQLIEQFVFFENQKLCRTQDYQLQLVVLLLNDFFTRDDPARLALFFNIFEIGKNSRKAVLLKFILTAIAIDCGPVSIF